MPWNGSGTFTRDYSWVADRIAGLDISSTRMDTDTDDIVSNGLNNCNTRDGQGSPTATQPMNGYNHSNVGNASARNQYAAAGQIQDGGLQWAVAGGTADALTLALSPAVTALVDGQLVFCRAAYANATTTPTFKLNATTAHTITKKGGSAVVAGDIPGALAEIILRYNLANTRWELLNPATSTPFTGGTLTSTLVMSGAAINDAFATIASASTVNIGAAAANYLQVTGTTGISAFDTVQAGTERTLEFAGALTITYNSTSMILPGGVNKKTAAGDVAIFRSEGAGNWRCVAYLPAANAGTISFHLDTGTNNSYNLLLSAPRNLVLTKVFSQTASGSVTLAVKDNGSAITGASAISVTNSLTTTTLGTPFQIAAGDTISLSFSSNSSATGVDIGLQVVG